MGSLRTLFLMSVVVLAIGCSRSGSRGGGSADDGLGDGNIPLAQAGKELGDVNFDFDSSALDDRAQGVLAKNARWLLDNPGRKVTVEGHCDERGTVEYNLALGERRALSAHDYLKNLGVKGDQMATISYGEELPLDPGHTESAWSVNRRAHFSLR